MTDHDPIDVLTLFLNHVKKSPKNLAVSDSDRQINYGEFANLAKRIAYQCKQRTTQPKVAILFSQSIEAYASMIGTLIAGGVYCPINTSSPLNKQKIIIDQFTPDLVIGETEFLQEHSKKYFTIDLSKINEN